MAQYFANWKHLRKLQYTPPHISSLIFDCCDKYLFLLDYHHTMCVYEPNSHINTLYVYVINTFYVFYRSNKQENNKKKIDFITAINFMNKYFYYKYTRPETLDRLLIFSMCINRKSYNFSFGLYLCQDFLPFCIILFCMDVQDGSEI